ncbi:glycosyltransferase family 4 protein [Planococcus sp. FY231025]|uniref:glycosyltransferase family 4 protein n=1 Tax=Planococcus sp. FY231025 TaxID=3455699 RepID=UPI003F8E68E0
MNIWILKHGEQLPLNEKSRVYRMGMIAFACINREDSVTWWTSNFNHALKNFEEISSISNKDINFIFLNGNTYSKNLSIKRVINHHKIGKQLEERMKLSENQPDIIISSMPTIDFAYKAVKFGIENNIPVIIDVRDLWPDVFKDLIPISFFRKEIFFRSFNVKLKWIFQNATAITAITEKYLEWSLEKGELIYNTEKHKVFPIGYPKVINTDAKNPLEEKYFNLVFVGTIGIHFDLETIMEVAKKTGDKKIRYYFIGDGDKRQDLEKRYPLSNVYFTGWLDGKTLASYLKYANIGIAPYKNTKNFLMNIPNKFYEYMANGLPVLSCLPGPSSDLIEKHNIGLVYKEKDVMGLYNCVIKLYESKDIYNQISMNAKRTFDENFSSNVIYSDYHDLIKNIVNEKKLAYKGVLNESNE